MKLELELINSLILKMSALDDEAKQGFGSILGKIVRPPDGAPEADQRTLVVNKIRRILQWWREVGHDRHYSQRCTAQVERCLAAAIGQQQDDGLLRESFNILYVILDNVRVMPDNQREFLCSFIEDIARDIEHRHQPNCDNIDLNALWVDFGAHTYPEFVQKLLAWCYDSDKYSHISDVCAWLFGCLPETDEVRKILKEGISNECKSERLRERFQWIYSRQFN